MGWSGEMVGDWEGHSRGWWWSGREVCGRVWGLTVEAGAGIGGDV